MLSRQKSSREIMASALQMAKKKAGEGCDACARAYGQLAVEHGATRRDFVKLGIGALAVSVVGLLPTQVHADVEGAYSSNSAPLTANEIEDLQQLGVVRNATGDFGSFQFSSAIKAEVGVSTLYSIPFVSSQAIVEPSAMTVIVNQGPSDLAWAYIVRNYGGSPQTTQLQVLTNRATLLGSVASRGRTK